MTKNNVINEDKEKLIDNLKENLTNENNEFDFSPIHQLLASFIGAVTTSFIVTPLDVIKVRLQAQQQQLPSSKCYLYSNGLMDHLCPCDPILKGSNWIHKHNHFNGTIDAFVKIAKVEGVLSLWSGLSPTLALALPTTMIYFVLYEQLRDNIYKQYMKARKQTIETYTLPFWLPIICGSCARTVAVTLVSPLELVRTKMQSQQHTYSEILVALRSLLKTDGLFGLWKGVGATLLRDVPFSAIYWFSYENLKTQIIKNQNCDNTTMQLHYNANTSRRLLTFTESFFCGAIAGSIAATVTVPFDVVKTYQQIEFGEKNIYCSADKQKVKNLNGTNGSTTMEVIKRIYKTRGPKGLFTGLVPRLVRVAPACAIMISSFEYGKQFFKKLKNPDTI